MSKVQRVVSQQVDQTVYGDLTVTGNILGKWASKIQAMLDSVLGSKWKAADFYAPVAGEPSLGTPHPHILPSQNGINSGQVPKHWMQSLPGDARLEVKMIYVTYKWIAPGTCSLNMPICRTTSWIMEP